MDLEGWRSAMSVYNRGPLETILDVSELAVVRVTPSIQKCGFRRKQMPRRVSNNEQLLFPW